MGDVDSKEQDNKNGVNDGKDLESITNAVSNEKMETIRNNSLIVDPNEKDEDESNLVIDLDHSTSKSAQTAKDKKLENVINDRNLWDSTVDELMKVQRTTTVDSSVRNEKSEDEKIPNDSVNDSVCRAHNKTRHGANEKESLNEAKEGVDKTKTEEGEKDDSHKIDHVVYLDDIEKEKQDKSTIVIQQIECEPANAEKNTNFTTEMDETDGDVEQVKQHAISVGETDTSVGDVNNGLDCEQTNGKQGLENVDINKSIHVLSKSDEINKSEMKGDGGSKERKQVQEKMRIALSKDTNGEMSGNSCDSFNTTRKEKTHLVNPCVEQKVIESKSDYLCKQCEKCQCVCSEISNKTSEISHQTQGQKLSSVANAAAKQQQASAAWSRLGVLRCEHCKFTTDDVSLIDSHNVICSKKSVKTKVMLSYSGEKFNCQTCGYPTSSRKKFEEHIALHLMIRPYICMTCDITFESKKEIEFHVKMKHANDAVKCGLKGSKRIGQIIDSLINSQKHEFLGRTVDKRIVQSFLETSRPKEKINASAVVAAPSLQTNVPVTTRGSISSNFVPVSSDADIIFVSSATTGITTTCVSSNLLSKQPETTLIGQPVPLTTQRPLILVPVNNMNTNMLVPFSNVVSQTNIHNVNTASSQSGVSVSTLPGSNQFINLAPVRFASQNISISGNAVHTNTVQGLQGNTIQATTLQGSNSIQGSAIQVNNMQTIQGNAFQTNTFQGVQGNASSYPGFSQNVNFQNNTTRFVLLPQTTINPVARSQAPLTNQQNKSISNISGVLLNHTPLMSLITPTVAQTQNLNTYAVTQGQTNTAASVTKESSLSAQNINCVVPTTNTSIEVLAKKDKSTSEDMKSSMVETNGNKLYFRKYGDLYMCDYCKSETPLEDSFKEHIWKHFHQMQKICKDCPPTFNVSAPCKIVLKVMIGLLSSSTGSHLLSTNKSQLSPPKDVVTISDDEDDGEAKLRVDEAMKDQNVTDRPSEDERSDTVKIASASEPEEEGLQLKITSSFSLSDTCESTEKTEPIPLKQHEEGMEDSEKNDTSNRQLISAKNDEATSSTVPEDSRKTEKPIETISLDSDESNSSDSHKSKALRVENDFNVEECEKNFNKTHYNEENLSKEHERLVEESHLQSGKSGIEDVILRETRKVSSNDEETEREGQSLHVQDIAVVAANIKEEIVNTDQDSTQLLFRIEKTADALAGTNDIDKKPIAFPLVAFYKCGFENCTFETTTSLEFREHLSQSHGDAVEYKCAHCGQKSFTEDSHIRHLLFHSKPQNALLFQCGVIGCRFRANLLHHYKDHLELSHQNVLLHRCHSCKEGYTSVDLLIEHLQSNLLKFVQCPYCTMKDGMRRNVLNHITAFHPGKPRQINVTSQLVCQERETNEFEKAKFKLPQETSNSILGNEQKKTTRIEPHKQGDTRVIEEKSSKLTDKVENDPEDAEMISKITSNPSIMGATYYRCKSCTYIGIGQNKLLKHMEMHTSAFIQSVQRQFICPDCPQAVNTLQQFISHLNLHVGDHLCYIYICQHCGFGTNLSNKINQHTADSHGTLSEEGKDYTQRTIKFSVTTKVCVKCNAAFKTSQAHRDHVLKSHGITTNEISGKDDLETEQHGQNIASVYNKISKDNDDESNPRRFTCNECGWASKKLPYLKSHMRKHYPGQDRCQITLFKCNYCDFTSTSKLIISAHSQKKHPGKIVRPRRVMENVYITDSIEDDMSIDKFHCDLCTFSTEKVSGLQNHLLSCHSGANNKTKDVYSGPKQEFLIPSGTVFKEFIQCPLCIFKTKKRIELLRHIKSHPSLEPKTESATEVQVSDRVQNPLFSKLGGKRRSSSDLNPVVKKPRPVSPTISYDRIMMDSAKRDTGYRKQVATKSTTNRPSIGVKSMLYYLGGEQLHMKLRPCFSEFKQSTHFTCLICSDVLDDKYKLHKHVLQHMNVYFYKCAYCDHGTLDQTTIMVHIQREHRRAIQYSKLDVEEIDSHINKAIHDMKSQVGSGQENIVFEEMHKESTSEKLKQTDEKDINQLLEVKNKKDEKITETPKIERESSIKSEIVSQKSDAPLLKHDMESPLQKERPFQAKIYPMKSTSSNLEKLFPIKSASSNVDKKSSIKPASSNLEKISPIKPASPNIEKKSPIKLASSNLEKKSPIKSTSSNLEKTSPQKQQILAQKSLKREPTFQHWGNSNDNTKEEEEPERQDNEQENDCSDDTIKEEVEDLHPRIKREKNNYVCTICKLKVSQKSAANKHIWTHSSVRRFVCSICNHISRWRGDITKHMDQKHKSEKAECLWDDVTPCDITEDGLPYNDLAKVQFLSTFNTIKSETLGSEQKLESDISDIKISSPIKRPLKVKLSVSKVEDKKQVEEQRTFKKLYKCLICKKTFKSKYAILGHFRTECKKPMFGCPSCEFKDTDEKAVKKHMKIKHGINNGEVTIKTRNDKIRMYRVPCGESAIKNEDNKKQLSGGIAFKCKACKRTFKNRNACMYHAISALCNKTLKGCSHCDYMDISTDNVESHVKKDHKEKNVKVMELPMEAKVEMISTPPSTKMNLNKSGTIAFFKKGSSGYTCRLCNFKCKNSAAVIKHQNMHNASPKYGCPYCDMKSNWTKSVKNHVSLRHPEQEQIVQSLNQDTEDYSSKDKKTDSISKVSNTTEDDKGKKCVMSKCLQCNYRCETYSGVSRHIKKNESCNVPRFKCIDCHKFTSLDEIEVKEHMRTAHNSKKSPGLCSLKEMTKMIIVRKKFSTKTPAPSEKDSTADKSRIAEKFSGMKDIETKVIKCPVLSCNCKDKIIKVIEHYRREHPTKVMRCKMCTMSSKSLGTMFQHFQDFHKLEEYYSTNYLTCSGSRDDNKSKSMKNDTLTNDDIIEQEAKTNASKLYHCDRCEYVSKAKNSTRRHIYRHMNYKRYLCRLCKAEFLDRSACESHMAIHNTELEEFDKITNERLEKEVEDILENNMVLGSKKSNSNSIEKVKLKKKEESFETIQETKSKTKQSMKSDSKNKNEIIKDCKGAVSNKIEKKRTSDLKKVDFTKLSADAFNQAYFIREERNKTTQEMEYLCTKCPYKSIAKHCALCHTYRHMPKCMKCPYCNFQSYPR